MNNFCREPQSQNFWIFDDQQNHDESLDHFQDMHFGTLTAQPQMNKVRWNSKECISFCFFHYPNEVSDTIRGCHEFQKFQNSCDVMKAVPFKSALADF